MGVYALRRLGRKIRDDNLGAACRLSGSGLRTRDSCPSWRSPVEAAVDPGPVAYLNH